MAENKWNKKIFAMLLTEAKGVRSWRQFAFDCGISYVQMRKLATATQENPPRPKLIRKVASQAFGEIDLEDLMFAAGVGITEPRMAKPEAAEEAPATSYEKYRSLSARDKKTVDRFIDFLASESNSEKEQKGNDK